LIGVFDFISELAIIPKTAVLIFPFKKYENRNSTDRIIMAEGLNKKL